MFKKTKPKSNPKQILHIALENMIKVERHSLHIMLDSFTLLFSVNAGQTCQYLCGREMLEVCV